MNTRRNSIEARLKALEERSARKRQSARPSMWARYWAGPVPSLREIFGDLDPKLLPASEVLARIDAQLPPVCDEFAAMTPEQVHDIYRQQIAQSKASGGGSPALSASSTS